MVTDPGSPSDRETIELEEENLVYIPTQVVLYCMTSRVHLALCNRLGDSAAASTLSEAEVDKRVKLFVEMEDPDVVMDLRELLSGKASKFDVFWEECAKFLQEEVGLAVDERRHSQVTHIACALSVRDLQEQVTSRCPANTPIPSRSWLSLQFWPFS